MYDLLIENAKIIDGRGNPWYGGSVAIAEGRIAAVGRLVEGEARERVDARGMYACPGFIDTHTHSDLNYIIDGTAQGKVRQGVTTEVTGNCGMSAAPALGEARAASLAFEAAPTWTTMAEYMEALDTVAKPVNIAPLVGHGTLRLAAVGRDNRPATVEEMAAMERLLEESLRAGVFGMSTGLYFAPGMYAPRDELVRLLRLAARHGTLMASHIRDEGTYTVGFIPAVQEIIDLGRASRCPVHFSHMKAHGPEVWGTSTRVLEMIEAARDEGIEVSLDQYPYEASGGGMVPDSLPHSFQAGRSSGGGPSGGGRGSGTARGARRAARYRGGEYRAAGWGGAAIRLVVPRRECHRQEHPSARARDGQRPSQCGDGFAGRRGRSQGELDLLLDASRGCGALYALSGHDGGQRRIGALHRRTALGRESPPAQLWHFCAHPGVLCA